MFEHADESNVLWSDEDGGCCLNISDKIVVLESVTLDDLIGFWAEFEARVRHELRGGSVCLNSFGRFVKWISASIMLPPSLVPAH